MKRLATLMLLIVSPLGCKDTSKPTDEEKAKVVPRGTGNLSGGGGAAQSVRKAAARTVNDHYLDQLRTMIAALELQNSRVPSAKEIMDDVAQVKPVISMINDEIVILTDTKMQNGIWAYTKWPQRAEKHYVITINGRGEMTADELETALKAQGSVVRLEK